MSSAKFKGESICDDELIDIKPSLTTISNCGPEMKLIQDVLLIVKSENLNIKCEQEEIDRNEEGLQDLLHPGSDNFQCQEAIASSKLQPIVHLKRLKSAILKHLDQNFCVYLKSSYGGFLNNDKQVLPVPLNIKISNKRTTDENQNGNFQNCPHCDYICYTKRTLEEHLHIHFNCRQCNYSCTDKTLLNKHLIIHSQEKPFQCLQCNFSSTLKRSLTRHELIHSGEKPFQCSQCDYSCRAKSSLYIHLRIHSQEKPFKCQQCDYSCTDKSKLKTHSLIHSRDKPFQCSHCQYICRDKIYLKRHLSIHSEEKPFQCLQCNFSCRQKRSLTRHELIHSGDKPFQCSHCSYGAIRKCQLIIHINVCHPKMT